MLREALASLRLKCAPGARVLGLADEAVAIDARFRRVGKYWKTHLEASKAVMLRAASKCKKTRRALVIGAGACLDVPVAELAEIFSEVILADAVVSVAARRWERRLPGRVSAVPWDVTGVLSRLAALPRNASSEKILSELAAAHPVALPGDKADLVVSANCVSQLGLIPADCMEAADTDERLAERCMEIAAQRHLEWLSSRAGVRVLLSDLARLDVGPDGTEIERRQVFSTLKLREPDERWRWDLAPIPELDSAWSRVHEVGAWID